MAGPIRCIGPELSAHKQKYKVTVKLRLLQTS